MQALAEDEVITCDQLEQEIVRIMVRKFSVSIADVTHDLKELLGESLRVVVSGRVAGVCRDPKDDFVLECAENGDAVCIVTGDKDLLSLESYAGMRIITPRQYLDSSESRQQP
jgi:putative PIN family toxin of toxin-antitoxin system